MDQLARTKPWVRFFSVMMFIGAGLMLIAALGMLLVGGLGAAGVKGSASALPAAAGAGIAIIYGAMAFIYIFPAMKL